MIQWLAKQREKARLVYAFRVGDICTKRKVGDGKTIHTFPTIHSVKFFNERTEFVFTLPNGVDPKGFKQKSYVFRQVFGRSTQVKGDLKRYVMNVYKRTIADKFNYNFNALSLDGLDIPILAGQDIRGDIVTYDMVESPHLLVAGETGSGKSTQLRSILTTLIQAKEPDQLRLLLGDLKRSEFHIFKNVSHVDEVCTTADDLSSQLDHVNQELDERGQILDRHEKTHMSQIQGADSRPDMIVCIDEVAMLKKEKRIMSAVEDISAIGRALGVYLILSMQRPDKDVLDGKLKNNLTVRMAFRHADAINSRITIGESGAEKLPSKPGGRMLFKNEGITEIQGPLLDDDKARKMLDPYRIKRENHDKSTEAAQSIFGRLEGRDYAKAK